ncbi:bactericidal permeability-increasing protein-like isoform 5-T7 [Macrochelys suwanniensis]
MYLVHGAKYGPTTIPARVCHAGPLFIHPGAVESRSCVGIVSLFLFETQLRNPRPFCPEECSKPEEVTRKGRREIKQELCPELGKGISNLERVLKTMQVSAQIDPFAAIDYSLVNKPVIAREHGDIDLKGEFYGVGKHTESPFSPTPFLLPDEGDHMLLLGLSEFSANSAAFVYFTAGALRKNFRDDMIPKRSPIRLNTGSMGLFLPELKKLYPNMPMELHLSARKQPLLTCLPDSLALALFGAAEAFVVLPNATLASAFLLDLDASLAGQLQLDSAKVGGSVALTNFSMSVVRSHVGSVQVKTLETLLKLALRMVALPMVNSESCRISPPRVPALRVAAPYRLPSGSGSSPLTRAPFVSPEKLKEGFPLPSVYNLSLVNPHVKINQVGISHGLVVTSVCTGNPQALGQGHLFRWVGGGASLTVIPGAT